eukprot:246456-Pleurochrysis_carterae.AAC.1
MERSSAAVAPARQQLCSATAAATCAAAAASPANGAMSAYRSSVSLTPLKRDCDSASLNSAST